MPVPIICLDDQLRQFAERFRQEFSKPQALIGGFTALGW